MPEIFWKSMYQLQPHPSIHLTDPRRGNRFNKRCDNTVTCEMGQCFWFFAWRNFWRRLTSPLLQWWYKKCQICFLFSRERIKTTFCNTAIMYIPLVEEIPMYIWQLAILHIITMITWHYKKPGKLGVLK